MGRNLNRRINSIERMLPADDGEPLREAIPSTWMEFGPDGQMVGPPFGVKMTPGQRRTWREVEAMAASVPFCPAPND